MTKRPQGETVTPQRQPGRRLSPSRLTPSKGARAFLLSPLLFPVGSCGPVLELFSLLSLTPTLSAQWSGAGGFSLLANDAPSQLHSVKTHSAGPGASDL